MKRYETETYDMAAHIVETLNLPKNASKGPMGDDFVYLFGKLHEELSELTSELVHIELGIGSHSRALSELADVGACLVGLREALIKLRGSNEDATVEDQEMVAGWEQDNVSGS